MIAISRSNRVNTKVLLGVIRPFAVSFISGMRLVHASSFVDIGWSQLEILVATNINEGREMKTMRDDLAIMGPALIILVIICLVGLFWFSSQDNAAMAQTTAEAFLHKLNAIFCSEF